MRSLSVIGVGNMAGAILRAQKPGLNITLFDVDRNKTDIYAGMHGYSVAPTVSDAVSASEMVLLSVKPQNFPALLSDIAASGITVSDKIFISIAAGVTMKTVADALGGSIPVVRVMPNTPLMVGHGVTAITRNELVGDSEFEEICDIFRAGGSVTLIGEDRMNAIISLTSSSPAYVFLFIKALCDGAKAQGFDQPDLMQLACDVLIGSAELLASCGKSADEMIRMVCSPGGTTEQAMRVLNERGFTDAVAAAMIACTARADELSSAD